jgi:hypothetical protein
LRKRVEAEDPDVPDNELIKLVLRDVGLDYFTKCAICMKKYLMKQPRGLYMGLNKSVQPFVETLWLIELNHYLLYFLKKTPSS